MQRRSRASSNPEGQVGGALNLRRCAQLSHLPRRLKVGGLTDARTSRGFWRPGLIDVSGCTRLRELPPDLGDLDLADDLHGTASWRRRVLERLRASVLA